MAGRVELWKSSLLKSWHYITQYPHWPREHLLLLSFFPTTERTDGNELAGSADEKAVDFKRLYRGHMWFELTTEAPSAADAKSAGESMGIRVEQQSTGVTGRCKLLYSAQA